MVLIRFILYFVGIALLTWLLVQMEIIAPGSLKLSGFAHLGDISGTGEYSPIAAIRVAILAVCGVLHTWVAINCRSQRPIAILFGGLAAIFLVREFDDFLDHMVTDNFWQVVTAVMSALLIVYSYRHRRRLRIAWVRIWPSSGVTLLFAGAVILFVFARLIGSEALWMAILGNTYQRIVPVAVEELMKIVGYCFWFVGTLEYAYQARAIAIRDPQPAAAKRRERRRKKKGGRW